MCAQVRHETHKRVQITPQNHGLFVSVCALCDVGLDASYVYDRVVQQKTIHIKHVSIVNIIDSCVGCCKRLFHGHKGSWGPTLWSTHLGLVGLVDCWGHVHTNHY